MEPYDSYNSMQRVLVPLFSLIVVSIAGTVILVNAPHGRKKQEPTSAIFTKPDSLITADTVKLPDGRSLQSEKRADSIIAFAKTFLGTPYYYTGKCKKTGFDCSGYTSFIYGHFGIEVSPASKEQIYAGREIAVKDAGKADLLIFTGTNISVREPGHVGIVITDKGKPIRFIHSSSSKPGGVMISQVDSTKYALRLLQVRRVLE
jgi:cell wall-associated NlpC family hydrolase